MLLAYFDADGAFRLLIAAADVIMMPRPSRVFQSFIGDRAPMLPLAQNDARRCSAVSWSILILSPHAARAAYHDAAAAAVPRRFAAAKAADYDAMITFDVT